MNEWMNSGIMNESELKEVSKKCMIEREVRKK